MPVPLRRNTAVYTLDKYLDTDASKKEWKYLREHSMNVHSGNDGTHVAATYGSDVSGRSVFLASTVL